MLTFALVAFVSQIPGYRLSDFRGPMCNSSSFGAVSETDSGVLVQANSNSVPYNSSVSVTKRVSGNPGAGLVAVRCSALPLGKKANPSSIAGAYSCGAELVSGGYSKRVGVKVDLQSGTFLVLSEVFENTTDWVSVGSFDPMTGIGQKHEITIVFDAYRRIYEQVTVDGTPLDTRGTSIGRNRTELQAGTYLDYGVSNRWQSQCGIGQPVYTGNVIFFDFEMSSSGY